MCDNRALFMDLYFLKIYLFRNICEEIECGMNKIFVFYHYNKRQSMKSKIPKNYTLKILNEKVTKKTIYSQLL